LALFVQSIVIAVEGGSYYMNHICTGI